jgi:hypothetical protein
LLSQLPSFSKCFWHIWKAWQLWEQYIKGGWCSIVSRMTTKHLMHINRGFTNSYALNVWCWTHVRLDVFCCWTHVRFGELLFPSTLWLLETSFIYRIEKICFFFGFIYLAMKKRQSRLINPERCVWCKSSIWLQLDPKWQRFGLRIGLLVIS